MYHETNSVWSVDVFANIFHTNIENVYQFKFGGIFRPINIVFSLLIFYVYKFGIRGLKDF